MAGHPPNTFTHLLRDRAAALGVTIGVTPGEEGPGEEGPVTLALPPRAVSFRTAGEASLFLDRYEKALAEPLEWFTRSGGKKP